MYERIVKSFQAMAEEAGYPGNYGDQVLESMTEDLRKALALGSYPATAGTATSDAGPLRLQNLDATMTSVLFTEQQIKLWNFLTKVPSPQPYYEWNRRRAYGTSRGSAGFPEGGAPVGGTAQFERNGIYNKFLGVRRGITHQLALTGQLGGTQVDPVAEENRNGTMQLMDNIERALVFSDSAILSNSGAAVNYDGILKQMKSTAGGSLGVAANVIDKGGAPMAFGDFEDAAERLYTTGFVSNFSDLHCFMTPTILADLSKLKYESSTFATSGVVGQNVDRRLLGGSVSPYTTGMPLKGHETNFGFIGFDPWIFTERVKSDRPTQFVNQGGAGDSGAPNTPGTATVAAAGTDAPKFTTAQAGAFYYAVAAINDSGESNASITAQVTPTSTQHVTVTFPALQLGQTGWRVYRSSKGGPSDATDAKWIADVAASAATYVDKNTKIPGTGYVFLLNKNPETLMISQMTPLIRYPLAIVSTTVEWLLLLYHVPLLKAGERIWMWENVGRL